MGLGERPGLARYPSDSDSDDAEALVAISLAFDSAFSAARCIFQTEVTDSLAVSNEGVDEAS